MKILITGGNGYIGRSLSNFLKDKYEVTSVTRQDFDLCNFEETKSFFKDKYFDVVIHCAVSGGSRLKRDDWSVLDTNLSMYYNLLQNRKSYKRLIHFGSGAEINNSNTPYGFSKMVIRKSILNQSDFYNIRIFATFDENELDTRFIKANIVNSIKVKPIIVHQNKKMDFFYMKDLVSLVQFYIEEKNPPKEINCSYDSAYDLIEIAKYIQSISETKVDIILESRNKDEDYVGKYTKIPISYIGLKKGIEEVYEKLKSQHA